MARLSANCRCPHFECDFNRQITPREEDVRAYIFGICTFLSSLGFFWVFLVPPHINSCGADSPASCSAGLHIFWPVIAYLLYLAIFFYAWFAYFKMGANWVLRRHLGIFWPVSGTLAGLFALSGIGWDLDDRIATHIRLMEMGSIVALPAILLALWMVFFHMGRAEKLPTLMISIGLATGLARNAGATDVTPLPASGTYEILICRELCASSNSPNIEVKGHVVLLSSPLADQVVKTMDGSYSPTRSPEEPNGCYELTRPHISGYHGYAGIAPFGITAWTYQDGTLTFALYHSDDAGYLAIVKPTPGGLFGKGLSWGAGVAAPAKSGSEIIVARRTGDADIRLCQEWSTRAQRIKALLDNMKISEKSSAQKD